MPRLLLGGHDGNQSTEILSSIEDGVACLVEQPSLLENRADDFFAAHRIGDEVRYGRPQCKDVVDQELQPKLGQVQVIHDCRIPAVAVWGGAPVQLAPAEADMAGAPAGR